MKQSVLQPDNGTASYTLKLYNSISRFQQIYYCKYLTEYIIILQFMETQSFNIVLCRFFFYRYLSLKLREIETKLNGFRVE